MLTAQILLGFSLVLWLGPEAMFIASLLSNIAEICPGS